MRFATSSNVTGVQADTGISATSPVFLRFVGLLKIIKGTLDWRTYTKKGNEKFIECHLELEHVYVEPDCMGTLDDSCFPAEPDIVAINACLLELGPDRDGDDFVRNQSETTLFEANGNKDDDHVRHARAPSGSGSKGAVYSLGSIKGKERLILGEAVRGDDSSLRWESNNEIKSTKFNTIRLQGDLKNVPTTESTALYCEIQDLKQLFDNNDYKSKNLEILFAAEMEILNESFPILQTM
ncbi:hypothetical protein HDU76_007480 [Blyttiomyces sp. JEL0837]|nr:hypothetical protein HDU76_007480 [Blyttiomyces sp. JEL0837]